VKRPSLRDRDARDRDLDDELRAHFAMAVADRIARGESPHDALAAAQREFGNITHVKEVTREMWGGAWIERLAQDARYAVRVLRRSPVFALTSIATLALGIGVTTAMFTVVRSVLLRPLPFAAPNELYVVAHEPDRLLEVFGDAMPDHEYAAFARAARTFSATAAYRTYPGTLLGAGEPARLPIAAVSPSFFATLGVRPRSGNVFASTADQPGADNVAIISASLARERFGADAAAIGRWITLDGYRKRVIGVMPEGFEFPRRPAVWVPLGENRDPKNTRMETVIARMSPSATVAQADAELHAFVSNEERKPVPYRREHAYTRIIPLRDQLVGDVRTPLVMFSLAVGIVLLIACANTANLTLMRATTRRHELAIRTSIGASRGRLVRQLLTETFVIAAAGGVVGLALAFAGVRFLLAVLPPGLLPRTNEVHVDPVAIGAAALAIFAAAALSGIVPAVVASRRDPREALGDAGRTVARAPLRKLFVAVEVGLSLVLLVGAGLMIRSFERVRGIDLGFTPRSLATATLDFPETRYRTTESVQNASSAILNRLSAIPGVWSASVVNWMPLDSAYIAGDFSRRDGPAVPDNYMVLKPCVSANYFATMGMHVREGRGFLPSDVAGAEPVVVISESMARALWPNGGAIGQLLTFANLPGARDWMRIVGIVDDVVHGDPRDTPMPALYRPIAQVKELFFVNHLTFVVRTNGDPSAVIGMMRPAIHAVDPEQPIASIASMDAELRATIAEPRFRSFVLIAFSIMALVMAGVGMYGVLAYAVSERTREFGIRLALGAEPRAIVRLIGTTTAAATVPGLVVGIAAALGAARLLTRFLFEVPPTDPFAFGGATGVLLAAAFVAAIGPARRAARVDPTIAMK